MATILEIILHVQMLDRSVCLSVSLFATYISMTLYSHIRYILNTVALNFPVTVYEHVTQINWKAA